MAIFIQGATKCCLCNTTIEKLEDTISFPPLVANKHDPLFHFNDSVVHTWCLAKHPMAKRLHELLDAYNKNNRTCTICHKQINNPDEYIGTGCLSSNVDALSKYNFTQYHKQCFEGSETQKNIRQEISVLREKGEWNSLGEF